MRRYSLSLGAAIAVLAPLPALAAAATDESVAAYPIEPVFTAFRDACGAVPDHAGAVASVAAAGWTDVTETGIPDLAEFLAFAEELGHEAVSEMGGTMSPAAVFSREVAGEQLAIVVTEVIIDGNRVTGCRLFDPEETRDVGAAAVTALVGAKPERLLEREGNTLAKYPALAEGQDSFDYFFVPSGSPLEAHVQFNGLAMKIDSVGPVPAN